MHLKRAFLIVLAFAGSFLVAPLLYVTLIQTLPQHKRPEQSNNKEDTKGDLLANDNFRFVTESNIFNPNSQWLSLPHNKVPLQRNFLPRRAHNRKFPFEDSFSFPQPLVMKPLQEIDECLFMANLRQFLAGYERSNRPLALITSNNIYEDVLLNWLISATVRSKIPLQSILVLSLDSTLHVKLTHRGISSVYVTPAMLFRPNFKFRKMFDAIMMLRLTIMRIIGHFGFDVVMYDTDAVILKDPQLLYDRYHGDDIIGSVGRIPYDLLDEWGITICIGVVLVRSTDKTEAYWNTMQDVCTETVDDQTKLNYGLKALDIHWYNSDSNFQNTTVHGECKNGLRVSILPYENVCRKASCYSEKRSSYYIWHKGGNRSRKEKVSGARDGRTWFLKYKWQFIRNDLKGVKWLESICYPGVTHE